jgi:hypothetical protein
MQIDTYLGTELLVRPHHYGATSIRIDWNENFILPKPQTQIILNLFELGERTDNTYYWGAGRSQKFCDAPKYLIIWALTFFTLCVTQMEKRNSENRFHPSVASMVETAAVAAGFHTKTSSISAGSRRPAAPWPPGDRSENPTAPL